MPPRHAKEVVVVAEDRPKDDSTASSKKRKPKRLWVWVGALLALVVVGFGAWEYTSTPAFCGSCHEIEPSVDGWRESAHADAAECMDCHADEGLVGEAVAHLGGLQEAYVHFSEGPEESDIRGMVPAERCMACHEDDWAELPEDHPTAEAQCGVCHRDSAHINEKPLFVTEKEGE